MRLLLQLAVLAPVAVLPVPVAAAAAAAGARATQTTPQHWGPQGAVTGGGSQCPFHIYNETACTRNPYKKIHSATLASCCQVSIQASCLARPLHARGRLSPPRASA